MLVRLKRYGGVISLPVLVAFGLSVTGIPSLSQAQSQARTAKVLFVPVQRGESVPEGVPSRVEEYFRALIEIEPRIKLVSLPADMAGVPGPAPATEPAAQADSPQVLPPLAPHPDLERAERLSGSGRDLARAQKFDRALSVLMQAKDLYAKRLGELEDFNRYVDVLLWISVSFLNGGYAEEGTAALSEVITLRPELSADAAEFGAKFVAAVDAAKKRLAEGPVVSVTAEPAEGVIYVDGRLLGSGIQVAAGLARGRHYVRVVADGYYPASSVLTTKGSAPAKTTVTLKSRMVRIAKDRKVAVAPEPKFRSLSEYARTGAFQEAGFIKAAQSAANKTLADFVLFSFLERTESAFHLGVFLMDVRNGELVSIEQATVDTDLGNLQIALLDLESRLAKSLFDFPRDRLVKSRPAIYDMRVARPVPAPAPAPAPVAVPVPVVQPPPVVVRQAPAPVRTQYQASLPPAAPVPSRVEMDSLPSDFPMDDAAPVTPQSQVPIYKKWWLWTIVGAVVAGGVIAAGVVVGTKGSKPGKVIGEATW
jgi:hypothetical protein